MPNSIDLQDKLRQLRPSADAEQLLLEEIESALADDLWVPNQILLAAGKPTETTLAAALSALNNEYQPPD